jgi:hypothetical protein
MQQVKLWSEAATVLLLCTMCCYLTQSAAAQRRQLLQASWLSQSLSIQVTINGPCGATGYPTDIGVTFADCARKDVERLPNVVVARTIRFGVQGAAAGSSCLTQKVSSLAYWGSGSMLLLAQHVPDSMCADSIQRPTAQCFA